MILRMKARRILGWMTLIRICLKTERLRTINMDKTLVVIAGPTAVGKTTCGIRIAERAALQRTGSPENVVQALLYLIGADFVTGHILPVDGGRLLGPSGPPI